tara:strand:+ start:8629 stop:9429 length:801 start_codon:yes stop_codon:yes gene_type:complete
MESEWIRASRKKPCPVCNKFDWCLIAVNGSAAICPRAEKGSVAYIDGSGWLHKFGDDTSPKPRLRAAPKPLPEHNSILSVIFDKYRRQMDKDVLESLSDDLGISSKSLDQMRVGFSKTNHAYAFPMLRSGNRFLGIRFRAKNGSKFAAKGSKQGLFVPSSFTLSRGILICEGPTDTAAMLDIDFNAIGRASCNSGDRLVKELVRDNPVAILADADDAGRIGARRLAKSLPRSVIIEPDGCKDARDWVASGVTRDQVLEKIRKARNV